jgi:hypothetical protein
MYPAGQQLKEDVAKQQPQSEIQKYAVYNIALFLPNPQGGDVVLPFMSQENKLVFYPPVSRLRSKGQDRRTRAANLLRRANFANRNPTD